MRGNKGMGGGGWWEGNREGGGGWARGGGGGVIRAGDRGDRKRRVEGAVGRKRVGRSRVREEIGSVEEERQRRVERGGESGRAKTRNEDEGETGKREEVEGGGGGRIDG